MLPEKGVPSTVVGTVRRWCRISQLDWKRIPRVRSLCLQTVSASLLLTITATIHISDCCQFSDIHISHGSVATYLRSGGMFKCTFIANLPMSLPPKEFWKLVNIWRSYGQEFGVFFDSQCKIIVEQLNSSYHILRTTVLSSVLWRCWSGGKKSIWVVGCWCGYLSGARCRLAYGPADATATHSLLLQ